MSGVRRGLGAVIALVAIAAVIAWLLRAGGDEGSSSLHRGAADPPLETPVFARDSAESSKAAEPMAPGGPPTGPSTAPTTGSDATSGRLVVHVIWGADRSPAADVGLALFLPDGPDPQHNIRRVRTDASGTWTLDPAPVGKAGVYTDRAGSLYGDVLAGQTTELSLEIPPGTLVRGLVVDLEQHAVAGADVWLSDGGNYTDGDIAARSGADGRFALRDVHGTRYLGARGAGLAPSGLTEIPHDAPPVLEVTLQLGGVGATLRGHVLDGTGAPAVAAYVRVGPPFGWPSPDADRSRHGPPPLEMRTDAEGRFVAADLPPGFAPIFVHADGWSPAQDAVQLVIGRATEMEIRLQPAATLSGTVRDATGTAVAGADVSMTPQYDEMDRIETSSDATGHYVLHDVLLDGQQVTARKHGVGEDTTKLMFEPGKSYEWDPQLGAGLQIVGHVEDAGGHRVANQHVSAVCYLPGKSPMTSAVTDLQGHFTLNNCGDGPNSLSVFDQVTHVQLAYLKDVRPGPDEVVLRLIADARPSAFVSGRVLAADGSVPPQVKVIAASAMSGMGDSSSLDASGVFHRGPLVPGDWDIVVLSPGRKQRNVGRFTLAADETRDIGTITLGDPGHVLVHVTLGAGVPVERVFCGLSSKGNRYGDSLKPAPDAASTWISGPVEPGDYVASVGPGSGGAEDVFVVPAEAPVHVEPGQEARVELFAEAGVAMSLKLVSHEVKPAAATVIAKDASGAEVVHRDVYWNEPREGSTDSVGFVSLIGRPGPYAVSVESGGKVVVEQGVTLPGGVNVAPDVEVVVP
jgi:Carboxypeptidase regulatory-like domain